MFGGAPARPFRPCLPVWRQKARAMEVPARVYRPRLPRPRKCPGGGVTLKLGVSDMQIDNIAIDRLSISKANMRQGKKPPDVSEILPSIIKRGVKIGRAPV